MINDNIDWVQVHQRLMSDFKTERLLYHLGLLGGCALLGLVLSYYFSSFNLLLCFVGIGIALDYLIFQDELLEVMSKAPPYQIEGEIVQKILQKPQEDKNFFFMLKVSAAYKLSSKGLDMFEYLEKANEQRIKVPESMFLSFKTGEDIKVVCTPEDEVWGIVRSETEVVYIEA